MNWFGSGDIDLNSVYMKTALPMAVVRGQGTNSWYTNYTLVMLHIRYMNHHDFWFINVNVTVLQFSCNPRSESSWAEHFFIMTSSNTVHVVSDCFCVLCCTNLETAFYRLDSSCLVPPPSPPPEKEVAWFDLATMTTVYQTVQVCLMSVFTVLFISQSISHQIFIQTETTWENTSYTFWMINVFLPVREGSQSCS